MMLYHQREVVAGKEYQFSFAGINERIEGTQRESRRAQQINGNHAVYSKSYNLRVRSWPQKDYENKDSIDRKEFQGLPKGENEDDGSDASPVLWKAGSAVDHSVERHPEYHDYHHDNHLYSNTRSEMIAKYQQEMMDLVRDVPEPAYELSLRDIVQLPRTAKVEQETSGAEEQLGKEKSEQKKRKENRSVKQITYGGDFLLNMFFPIIFEKSKSEGGSKLSPEPIQCDEKFDPDRKGRSRNSSRSKEITSNHRSKKMSGCYSFFCVKSRREKEHWKPHPT